MLGFLHTADANRVLFAEVLARLAPEQAAVHRVEPELLELARAGAPAELQAERVRASLRALLASGARALTCTCSSIGALAEAVALPGGAPVLRVDRALAEQAVARGTRLVVVAALESAVAPTLALLHEVAARRGVQLEPSTLLCAEAWPLFEAGDRNGYESAVARAIDAHRAADVDGYVLAQASLAGVAQRCAAGRRVWSSPEPGVAAALRALRARPDRAAP